MAVVKSLARSLLTRRRGNSPDRCLEFFDEEFSAHLTLSVGPKQSDEKILLIVEEFRVANRERTFTPGRKVLDSQRVFPVRAFQRKSEIGAGRKQSDQVGVGILAVVVVDEELGVLAELPLAGT